MFLNRYEDRHKLTTITFQFICLFISDALTLWKAQNITKALIQCSGFINDSEVATRLNTLLNCSAASLRGGVTKKAIFGTGTLSQGPKQRGGGGYQIPNFILKQPFLQTCPKYNLLLLKHAMNAKNMSKQPQYTTLFPSGASKFFL